MTDKHPEAIQIDFGNGEKRTLKLGPSAFRLAYKKHGVKITAEDVNEGRLDLMAMFLWVGLLPDEPNLDEDTVLGWLASADEMAIMEKVAAAVSEMQPKKKKGVPRPGKK